MLCCEHVAVYRAVIELLVSGNKELKNLSMVGSRQNELKASSITEQFEELIERRLGHRSMVGL